MPSPRSLGTLVDGLNFPEAPRWHDGRLWCSDFFRHQVLSIGPGGDVRVELEVPERPSGLGWRADGTLLVVSMHDHRLLARREGQLHTLADLSAHVGGPCNDLVVDAEDRAYVGNFGFDLYGKAEPRPTGLLCVDPDGTVRTVAHDLWFPNGMAITPDGTSLIVAETYGHRLTRFVRDAHGSLRERRVFAELPGVYPDGLCLDAEGAIWVADATGQCVLRVKDGQGVVDRIGTGEHRSYACMLGGDDGRTLFICCAPGIGPKAGAKREGRILAARVDVPHAGRP